MLIRNTLCRAACALVAVTGAVAGHPASALAAKQPAPAPGQPLGSLVRTAEQAELNSIEVPAAWRLSRGQGVTVGVLDTGVGRGVPDLTGSVRYGPDFTRGINPPGYHPPHLHGTFIASLIAAHGSGPGDSGGVIGVAPAARVLSVRVLPDDSEPGFALYNSGAQFDGAVAKGIRYAVRRGVGVINMSLGSAAPTRATQAALGYAVSRGVVVVAAAGNNGSRGRRFSPYSYPASYPGVISVAALTPHGARASFSEQNASVLVAAPGVGIVGAGPNGSYLRADGTSPASAFVAGVAALIRSVDPRLSPALVTQAIITSTRHHPPRGYSPATGFGEVDAVAALRAAAVLAATRPVAGLTMAAHFGAGPPGPIQVVHRDASQIAAYTGVAVGGGLGFVACLVALVRLGRRGRRLHTGSAVPPAGGTPGGDGWTPSAGQPGRDWNVTL
ncbi:MAG TPA: S8 family serine peptidase [Streptosporangiaceae bacterium]|nr:S8 family serine peptidase [Streptosporangiaceae bacterium]